MSFRGVVYNESQIDAYFTRIGFPDIEKPNSDNVASAYGLQYLRRLQKYQQSACPFENLNMHYTQEVIKSLKPKDLYEKFVTRRWGGTCTENNTFFGIMLRSLGYKVRPVGGRVNIAMESGKVGYGGWNHCVNLVTIEGQKYLVDVAMGPASPAQPMPLGDGVTAAGIGATTCRLRWDTLPEYTDPDSKLWIYEQNNDGKSDFLPAYCFTELEFLPQDYDIMKTGTTFNRRSWFTWRIVVTKTILEGENEDVVGNLILVNNSLKKRVMGKSETIATFKNEQERIQALKDHFGIEMNEDERTGIMGMVTYLGDAE